MKRRYTTLISCLAVALLVGSLEDQVHSLKEDISAILNIKID